MKIIVGLGNPGRKYSGTRHNIGYRVVEELAVRHGVQKEESRFDAILGHLEWGSDKVIVAKPLTYMNLSGKSVQPLVKWYKIELSDLIVVCDDMDLPPGKIRLRPRGGTGGHRGLASISECLGGQDFARLRLGVGHPLHENQEVVNWVLGKFSTAEEQLLGPAVNQAVDALETWVREGLVKAMNSYNG
jgi:PTH1 family peptidyl-tRNA hydrolase